MEALIFSWNFDYWWWQLSQLQNKRMNGKVLEYFSLSKCNSTEMAVLRAQTSKAAMSQFRETNPILALRWIVDAIDTYC